MGINVKVNQFRLRAFISLYVCLMVDQSMERDIVSHGAGLLCSQHCVVYV
jgi:hypothetical protein